MGSMGMMGSMGILGIMGWMGIMTYKKMRAPGSELPGALS